MNLVEREPPISVVEPRSIEDLDRELWGKVGGAGRLRRTVSLFAEFRERRRSPESPAST